MPQIKKTYGSSSARRRPRSATVAHTIATVSAPPFRFTGQRLAFLESFLDRFDTVCKENRYRPFWREIFKLYWHHFPWRLPIDNEPHCAILYAIAPRGEEELNEMTAITIATETRIKRFFFDKHYMRRLLGELPTAADIAAAALGPANAPTPHYSWASLYATPPSRQIYLGFYIHKSNRCITHTRVEGEGAAVDRQLSSEQI
ncbi:hypothetical protein C8R45DRAFT_1171850 [Mycena sanguinolenta]|nr:hypothetical protein C8R45DRAFT_1171850 [Mycena sanguinolenta]